MIFGGAVEGPCRIIPGGDEGEGAAMRVLVVHAGETGGTEGLAHMITEALADRGLEVHLYPAAAVRNLVGFDAVVVAGALYAHRWHRDARRFVLRTRRELRRIPVWVVASGPLDDSARGGPLQPVPEVASLMSRIAARGHRTFGGRLVGDVDHRDHADVEGWVEEVVGDLLEESRV